MATVQPKQPLEVAKANYLKVCEAYNLAIDGAAGQRNFDMISHFISQRGGDWSIDMLFNAALSLKLNLQYADKSEDQAAATAQPAGEQLEPWQIPLDPAPSKYTLSKASKEALADYLKRAREAAGMRYNWIAPSHQKNQGGF